MPRSTSPVDSSASPSPTRETADPTSTSLLFTHQPESPTPSPESSSPTSPEWSPSTSPEDPSLAYDDGSASDLPWTAEKPAPSVSPTKRRKQLLPATTAAVETVTGGAHMFLTAEGSAEREHGLWLATDDETKAIAEPLAGLASRRMPEGVDNPDISDLIRLAMGVAAYAIRQVHLRSQLRALFRRQATPVDVAEGMNEESAEQ